MVLTCERWHRHLHIGLTSYARVQLGRRLTTSSGSTIHKPNERGGLKRVSRNFLEEGITHSDLACDINIMAESASLVEPMELDVEPISQVSEAWRIIEAVRSKASSKFLVNKRQCERLAHRLVHSIGEPLQEMLNTMVSQRKLDAKKVKCEMDNQCKMEYPAFELLVTVLKKAKALLSKYTESRENIPSYVLTRTEDREAFKEIHAELNLLNSHFPFDDFEYCASSESTSVMLTGAADEDKNKLSESLQELVQSELTLPSTNLEKMKLVVTEKSSEVGLSSGRDDQLPSFLSIDPASVEIHEVVRVAERLSEHDPVETDGWACVRLGRYLSSKFALKVFESGNSTWNKGELLKEVRSLMTLHHPHIVQLMGFAQAEERCIILMELMDTDLRHFMKQRSSRRRPFDRAVEMDIITQIARALYYLHEQGFVHGELKCSNILVKQIGDHIDVKVSDLRSSQKLGTGDPWDPELFKKTIARGRPRWTAPEVARYVNQAHHDHHPVTDDLLKKSDVYSFGMVCYEVLTGKLPFQDVRGEALKKRVESGELKQELPGELDAKLRGLIESCWSRDPNDRPTFEVICHFLNDIRCSLPLVTAISFGIDTALRHFRQIFQTAQRFQIGTTSPVDVTAWKRQSTRDDSGNGIVQEENEQVLTLPEFVRIEPSKLKTVGLIGRGAFGEVYEVTWLGCKYAVKTFKSTSPSASVQKEVKFLVELRHPCIVRMMGLAVHSERRCSIVMEFMGCDLRKLIDSRVSKRKRFWSSQAVPFDLRDAVHIINRIALGMAFLHSRGVIHRDLNAGNVLVPDQPGSIDVKISDFGMSHLIESSEEPMRNAGTGFWRAPELFVPHAGGYCLKATDVYSFAMTCYEVLTGQLPLIDQINVLGSSEAVRSAVIEAALRPVLPSDLNPGLKLLIEECWDGSPGKRPSFSSICERLQTVQQGLHY